MTAQDHIVAWIESSASHYARLLKLAIEPKERGLYRATTAANLATSAYHQMVYFSTEADKGYTAQEILGAAIDLLNWEKPESDQLSGYDKSAQILSDHIDERFLDNALVYAALCAERRKAGWTHEEIVRGSRL